jgi:hypothetical protein
MASAPKLPASASDEEAGRPRVFVPRGRTPAPEPTAIDVAPVPKSPDEEANAVLKKAFGPISPSAKNATEKGGRKHRTRKHKKHARKTKKHLRRK